MELNQKKDVAVIVAHPDDETLWAGGTILNHPEWEVFIISLCRGSDTDRAPKFSLALKELNAQGKMGDMDDSPELKPLDNNTVKQVILDLLPAKTFDLIITHHPRGEYTRHLRHEETSEAVINLWYERKIDAQQLWVFAYEDGRREYHPRADTSADFVNQLDKEIWLNKYKLITEIYGFDRTSWEAQTTPQVESFWQFTHPNDAFQWLHQQNKI